ncbi:MAG: agmatinase [Betaproteobacteria bacterium]|nr:agmatinase [Betaproteobacteria bacterium]
MSLIGEFAYAQNSNRFLAVPPGRDQPYCVVGVPYDGAVTNRPGARFGPQEIRRASLMLCDGEHPHFNVSPWASVCDAGDLRVPNTALAAARTAIEREAAALMAQHHCVFLGGDHSITMSLLRAQRARHGAPLAMIHFDAHCDTWQDHFDEPSGHGTWTYEAIREGLVDVRRTVQVGLRSSGERAAREYVRDQGGAIYTARDLRGLVGVHQLAPVLQEIRARIGTAPCYLTLDIDCLDPAYAPGTGTPEPGGLSSAQVMTFLEELSALNFIGMDCVEVAPAYDHAELTSQAAACFVWTYLAGRVAQGTRA